VQTYHALQIINAVRILMIPKAQLKLTQAFRTHAGKMMDKLAVQIATAQATTVFMARAELLIHTVLTVTVTQERLILIAQMIVAIMIVRDTAIVHADNHATDIMDVL